MRVVVAVPTIADRPGHALRIADVWRYRTPGHQVDCIITTAGTSWGDGLNDAYEQVRDDPPAVFVCGSDDMEPINDRWLPAVTPWLERNVYPVPRVSDPRFENWGGPNRPDEQVSEGHFSYMSTFPILRGDWLDRVFPVPEGLHYFCDNWLAVRLALIPVQAVAVPACHINHLHAHEGRGAGYGSEGNRLHIDTVRYTRALEEIGVDRRALHPTLRGHMWQEEFLKIGREMGA